MMRNEYITEAQYDSLKVLPLDMSKFKKVTFTDDKAPYLCDEVEKDVKKILDAPECRKSDGSKYNIYKDGLKIYTTIDPLYQQYAEEAMQEHMKKIQKRFFEVWRGKDPWNYKSGKATDDEIRNRKERLWDQIRAGDRFLTTRPLYFDAINEKIQSKYNAELRDADIMPLTCEYQEKFYAAGKIPGSYFRREGRPTTDETLVCRLMDRPSAPPQRRHPAARSKIPPQSRASFPGQSANGHP